VPRARILLAYFFGDDVIPLGASCAAALETAGYEVCRFASQVESLWQPVFLKPLNRLARGLGYRGAEIGGSLPIARVNFKKRMLLQAARRFRPRWVLVIRGHEFVDSALVERLKRECGVEKVACWRVGGPLQTPDLLEDARVYDVYFCSHRYGYDGRFDRIRYLPVYGMDFSLFRNLHVGSPRPFEHEITLVGGHNERRLELLRPLLELPLDIYGQWGRQVRRDAALRKRVKAKGVWGDALLRLYNRSKIVLNITGWDPARYPALNQRVFDVPATGAFLLTDYAPELEEHYRLGEEIVCYRDAAELEDKARYYLSHDAERDAIGQRGYAKALRLPTIGDRMAEVVRQLSAS
jgi:spore maturation protein CgeB